MISTKDTYDFDDPRRLSFPVQSRSGYFVSAPTAVTVSSKLIGVESPPGVNWPVQLPVMLGPIGAAGFAAGVGDGLVDHGNENCAVAGAIAAAMTRTSVTA